MKQGQGSEGWDAVRCWRTVVISVSRCFYVWINSSHGIWLPGRQGILSLSGVVNMKRDKSFLWGKTSNFWNNKISRQWILLHVSLIMGIFATVFLVRIQMQNNICGVWTPIYNFENKMLVPEFPMLLQGKYVNSLHIYRSRMINLFLAIFINVSILCQRPILILRSAFPARNESC